MRTFTRTTAVLGLLLAWTGLALLRPAWSCGCGAMVTSGSEEMQVTQETSIVRFDDRTRTEQIVMRLSVRSKAEDAAWLFPTPSAAQVGLGDRTWFAQLDKLTEPQVVKRRKWWGRPGGDGATGGAPKSGAPGKGSVAVLGEKRLGPFQVATLASSDSKALAGWLRSNGYKLNPRLEEALQPYVKMRWKYVAVKLAPDGGKELSGELDPLHVTFRSDRIVYPMRLSRLAKTDQAVHLYVLGSHRVEHQGPRGHGFGVNFAGWVEPAQVPSAGLKGFLGGKLFLTEVLTRYLSPKAIDDDFHYRYTADTLYRETVYDTEYVDFLGIPAGYAIMLGGGGPAGGLMAVVVIAVRRRAAAGSRRAGAGAR